MLKDPSSSPKRFLQFVPAMLAVGLPLLGYWLTLYPGVGDRQGTGDAIEYQFVGRILSIPHEPGYPQYVLLSHLWSLLPLPLSLATKINLLSAVFTVVAGLFIFSSARALSRDVAASVIATWMVMITPNVWLLSTQAEVYTLNLMWVSAVLWAALKWFGTGQQKYLVALFFFYALSFGNHLTMITLLPGLAFLILAKDPKVALRWQNWVWSTLAILTGLLQYGLLLWRSYHPHPALLSRFPRQANLDELLEYVSGSRFVDRHFLKTGFESWLPRLWEGISHSVEQLTLPFAMLCGLGFFLGFREHRRPTIFLVLTAGTVMAFAAAYGIKDSLFYTIPAWVCAALLGAVGLSGILSWSRGWRRQIVAILALLVVSLTVWRGSRLAVVENPTDLESVITAATPGSGILAAIKQRRARLLRLYYRYGQVTEKAHQVDFHSVDEILASGLENVRDQTLFFRDPEAARRLDRAVIDYRLLQTLPNGQSLYLSEPEEPLEALALRPLWDGSLAITLRERSLDLLGAKTLHLFLVSSKYGRSKGYVAIDIESPADWRPLLESALAVAASGDRFLLVAPRLAERPRRDLARILESQKIDLLSLPVPQHHTVAWWTAGGSAKDVTLISDLAEELILEIDSPVDDPEDSRAAN
jgi:hypothetical protein